MTESGPTYRGSIHRDGHIVKVVLNAKFQCMKEVNLLKFQIAETNLTHWIKTMQRNIKLHLDVSIVYKKILFKCSQTKSPIMYAL